MKGYIHSIETFGTVDGPGIRYVVFYQAVICNVCSAIILIPGIKEENR